MKIFISQSGDLSHSIAVALREWLPKVIQAVEPFVSSKDIDKGTPWFSEIGEQLDKTDFGIICVTPDNTDEPWLLFEAGALAKHLGKSRVVPFLFELRPAELRGPLAQFQAMTNSRENIKNLLRDINKSLGEGETKLGEKVLEETFKMWWPHLEAEFEQIQNQKPVTPPRKKRADREILEEILQLSRNLAQGLTELKEPVTEQPSSRPTVDDALESLGPKLRQWIKSYNPDELLKLGGMGVGSPPKEEE